MDKRDEAHLLTEKPAELGNELVTQGDGNRGDRHEGVDRSGVLDTYPSMQTLRGAKDRLRGLGRVGELPGLLVNPTPHLRQQGVRHQEM